MLQIILFIFNSILFFIRHAYPETAYIAAAPTGTIGPITVRHYELFKSFSFILVSSQGMRNNVRYAPY